MVVGAGYVGLSAAILLSQYNDVVVLDILQSKVDSINKGEYSIIDNEIKKLIDKKLNLFATTDSKVAYDNAEFIIVAVPTNFDSLKKSFDTKSVESVVEEILNVNSNATIVIKSTIPIGYTKLLSKKYATDRIIFAPEFLRENRAVYDNLYPSRIIIGVDLKNKQQINVAQLFANLLQYGAIKENIKVLFMESAEAEAVKLFANTYLALRVAFFNEVDTYAETKGFDIKSIINGVCLDPRIGEWYNNPSFGYGGYCLPKDTKQLLASYDGVPSNLIEAIIHSNSTRKDFIVNRILCRVKHESEKNNVLDDKKVIIGIYRLVDNCNSDNFRYSSVLDIVDSIKSKGINIVVYEPILKDSKFEGSLVVNDLEIFKKMSNLIITNRYDSCLANVVDKVYTRDLFKSG